jgi:predicted nucleic acid-binding protein
LNGIYLDAAYLAKCYLHEHDSVPVRELVRAADGVSTSAFSIAEMGCVFHRHLREGTLTKGTEALVREQFLEDLRGEVWTLVPLTEHILRKVEFVTRSLPRNAYLRAGDAVHLVSAMEAGFDSIWTNDRHLLAAAEHVGIKGRQIAPAG